MTKDHPLLVLDEPEQRLDSGGRAMVAALLADHVAGNELLPLDTPMGTISTGPLANTVIGPDALLLGLPALVEIAQGNPLSWATVLVQAVVAVIGARAYLSASTATDRTELTR